MFWYDDKWTSTIGLPPFGKVSTVLLRQGHSSCSRFSNYLLPDKSPLLTLQHPRLPCKIQNWGKQMQLERCFYDCDLQTRLVKAKSRKEIKPKNMNIKYYKASWSFSGFSLQVINIWKLWILRPISLTDIIFK